MTNSKVSFKIKLFSIVSAAIVIVGLIVGTVCHFVANGFFNYGDEFQSYQSVVVRFSYAEYTEETVKPVCEEALRDLHPSSVSSSEVSLGGEIVYTFSVGTDSAKLQAAVDSLNAALDAQDSGFNVASLHQGVVNEGGSRALIYAAIAVASAAAFQFLYYVFRYKLRAAFSALLACVHNLGVFVALVALVRVPVGAELITVSALVAFVTMIGCGVFFDRTRKNFANEKYAKNARAEVIALSAKESVKINAALPAALLVGAVVLGVFAAIASLNAQSLFLIPVAVIAMFSCAYGLIDFVPAVHVGIDALCEKVRASIRNSKDKPVKTEQAKA